MDRCRQMTLLAFDDRPKQRNGTTVIENTGHQHHTPASSNGSIQHHSQWRRRQALQHGARKRQPHRLRRDRLVLNPAPKAANQTLVFAPANRYVIGDLRKLDMLSAHNPANQQGQGVEVLLLVAIATGVQHLRQGTFDGTIGLEVDVHGTRLVSDLVSMTEG